MLSRFAFLSLLAVAGVALPAFGPAKVSAIQVQVSIESLAPDGGVVLTPVWVGFHDGSFDSYNGGLTSQEGLQRVAEDGDNMQISEDFAAGLTYVQGGVSGEFASGQDGAQRVQGTIGSDNGTPPPIQPGETATQTFTIAPGENTYFSYASMILPSNDFFVANGNPLAHDLSGLFSGASSSISFVIGQAGTVNDAGTEAEDFDFAAPPLGGLQGLFPGVGFDGDAGQTEGNQGPADSNSLIRNVSGDPFAGFLNSTDTSGTPYDLSQLDFNDTSLYTEGIARITISVVPEPTSALLIGLGVVGALLRRKRA